MIIKRFDSYNYKVSRCLFVGENTLIEIVKHKQYGAMYFKLTLIFNHHIEVEFYSAQIKDFFLDGVVDFKNIN